jgi:hypothetical protein
VKNPIDRRLKRFFDTDFEVWTVEELGLLQ